MKDLMQSAKYGTTRPTAAMLALMSCLQGVAFWIVPPEGWLNHPSFDALLEMFSYRAWAILYGVSGIFAFWRVFSPKSKPITAWVVNACIALVWLLPVLLKMAYVGWWSLFSPNLVIAFAALWLLLRTEATVVDRRVA